MSTYTHPHELLPWAAQRYDAAQAIRIESAELTYRQLADRSGRFAAGLVALGVRAGRVVTVFLENRWEWLVAYHGVLRAGAIVNPVNAMLTSDEIAFVVGDCGSVAVVTTAPVALRLRERAGELPALQRLVVVDDAPSGTVSFDELLRGCAEPPSAPHVAPGDPCSISYTSGTTGHPKGAVQPQRALRFQWGLLATLHGRTASDVMVSSLPFAHVYGNVTVHGVLTVGGRSVFTERFDAKKTIALLESERATIFEGVPTMYALMLAEPSLAHADLSSLRLCTVGGQVMPQALFDGWLRHADVTFAEVWGQTECAGFATTHPVNMPRAPGTVGVAAPGVEVRVADLEDPDRAVPDGTDGELQIRGPIVMLGYLNRPEATAEAILPSGFLRTGDIGRRDVEGNIAIVDRIKDLIITGGFNVYPAEIERVVARHPAVAMVGVAGEPDPVKGEIARAYVVLRPGAQTSEAELIAHCKETLAAYKVPRRVSFVDDLPRTSTGKIMRRRLRDA